MTDPENVHSLSQDALALLNDALAEARATARAYDTKAQIVGVGYAFALGIVAGTTNWFPKSTANQLMPVLVFWGVIMTPLVLFGSVLYPTRKTAPKLASTTLQPVEHILYVDPEKHHTLESIRASAEKCEPVNEIIYELLKTSGLRELKRNRFIRALLTAAFSFFALFAVQVFEAISHPSIVG